VRLPSFFDKGKRLSRLGNRIILQQPIFRIGMRQHCSTKEAFLERFGVAVYWINWTVCSYRGFWLGSLIGDRISEVSLLSTVLSTGLFAVGFGAGKGSAPEKSVHRNDWCTVFI
jgi:hypothetical protein